MILNLLQSLRLCVSICGLTGLCPEAAVSLGVPASSSLLPPSARCSGKQMESSEVKQPPNCSSHMVFSLADQYTMCTHWPTSSCVRAGMCSIARDLISIIAIVGFCVHCPAWISSLTVHVHSLTPQDLICPVSRSVPSVITPFHQTLTPRSLLCEQRLTGVLYHPYRTSDRVVMTGYI